MLTYCQHMKTNSTDNNSSTRSDSQSQNVFAETMPANTFLAYISEDGDYELRWHGGAYIDCGYGPELRYGAEFKAEDIINVYDYANSAITISTPAEFAALCEKYVREQWEKLGYE